MPCAAWQVQQEVDRTLHGADIDLRDLADILEKAKASANSDVEERRRESLRVVCARLRDRRAEVRKWAAQLDAHDGLRSRLELARSRIEQEIRRLKDFESSSEVKVSKASELLQPLQQEVKVLTDQLPQDDLSNSGMTEEFICKICLVHVVGCAPRLTRCSHLFCGDCLGTWFATQPGSQTWAGRAQAAGSVPCPACKEPLHPSRDIQCLSPQGRGCSALVWQLLRRTKIVCANHRQCDAGGTCEWVGDYGSYQEHARTCGSPALSCSPASMEVESSDAECASEGTRSTRLSSGAIESGASSESEAGSAGASLAGPRGQTS
mmetsp:Transcript_45283/g.101931  ORF Transcript_45283/g.101931 Transcript_45283/m.101931 type:complete len:321 (-) Transcript_45283:100-1062(-)